MTLLSRLLDATVSTVWDVLPILLVIAGFQLIVLRRPIPRLPRVGVGFAFVIAGLALFLLGLELALFPLGEAMALQLASPAFLGAGADPGSWREHGWTYAFAFAIGLSTTIAEPSLIAVAQKAEQVSGGTVRAFGLRMAVALGVAVGVTLGTFRIITGGSLPAYIIAGYAIALVQTAFAPRDIIPLAYDSGGVTTSTVTVPLVAALGLGLAREVPGRDPLVDGFGLIAFASVFPIITVLAYAQLARAWTRRRATPSPEPGGS